MKYPGAKNGEGVWQRIVSEVPYHTRRFEPFAGTAAIARRLGGCDLMWLNDLNPEIVAWLKSNTPPGTVVTSVPAMDLLCKNVYTAGDFIYLDPPYLAESRRSDRKLYKHEMMGEEEHVRLLDRIKRMKGPYIMISTKPSALYDKALAKWRKVEINTIDRSGEAYQEVIYMNYPAGLVLHNYDHIGEDYIQRQALKRMADNARNKVHRLPDHERQLFVKSIIDADPDLAQHFLSVILISHSGNNLCSRAGQSIHFLL